MPKRKLLYVATGNGYADPPQPMTNAIIAMDLATGAVKWVNQVLPNDVWAMGCKEKNPDNPVCPETMGPDYDFSAAPALIHAKSGKDLIVLPQKSGTAHALDPDNGGKTVWTYQFGKGSGLGGQWGTTSDGEVAYFGTADLLTPDARWHDGAQPRGRQTALDSAARRRSSAAKRSAAVRVRAVR